MPNTSTDPNQPHDNASSSGEHRSDAYQDARKAFDGLRLEERAFFLLDAAASTLVRTLEEAGAALAKEMDAFFSNMEHADDADPSHEKSQDDNQDTAQPTAEGKKPDAASQKKTADNSAPKKSAPKKSAPKKSTAKKSTSRKSSAKKASGSKKTAATKKASGAKKTSGSKKASGTKKGNASSGNTSEEGDA